MTTLTTLFKQIEDEFASNAITGWCELPKALELAAAVVALKPLLIVELGVWGGKSLIPMALACQAVGRGVVMAVDPWSPVASCEGYDAVNARWWGAQDHERVYRDFIGHLDRLDLRTRVDVWRGRSDEVDVPMGIGLLHIDGQHSEQAARDVARWAHRVHLGGLVCMDDLEWTVDGVPHVAHAVQSLLSLGFMKLHQTKTEKSCWGFFQRVIPNPSVRP